MSGKVKLRGKAAKVSFMLLQTVTAILDRHGVHYALTGGTLLGIVREGRFLPWDTDVDLMVNGADQHALTWTINSLNAAGLTVKVRKMKIKHSPLRPNTYRMIKAYKDDLVIDLIVKYSDQENFFWCVSKLKIIKRIASNYYRDLEQIDFNNQKFWAPRDVDGYLTARYGEWRTPVKKYNYKQDDSAIVSDFSI